jgi:cation diffusion facilitator family transporter
MSDAPASLATALEARARIRGHAVTRVLSIVLVLNLGVAVAKLVYGVQLGTVALVADGVHSVIDALANVVALVGIAVAARPPDANHPYGHRKYETVAALGVAAMLFVGCWEILSSAIARLRHPHPVSVGVAGFAVIAVTLIVNGLVVLMERREARRLDSELLAADAAHTSSDLMATALVLASFLATQMQVPHADALAAVLIVVLIVRAGIAILKSTVATLSDERRIPPLDVERVALQEPGVREAHNVRSRGTRDDIHVDLHILVDPAMPIADAHAIGHRVEQRLRGRWPGLSDVVVHVEPAVESERARTREGGGLKAEG